MGKKTAWRTACIEVEVDLSDFDAEDLADELRTRGYIVIPDEGMGEGVKDAGWLWRRGDYVDALIQLARETGEDAFLNWPRELEGR